FPRKVRSHIAAPPIDAMATEAGKLGHQLACVPGRSVIRVLNSRHAQTIGHRAGATRECKQRGGQRIRLRGGQYKLRHLDACAECSRLTNFGSDVTWQRLFHAWQEDNLRQRLASNGAEFGCEVLWFLYSIDFVASRASQFDDQLSSVSNLLQIHYVQM